MIAQSRFWKILCCLCWPFLDIYKRCGLSVRGGLSTTRFIQKYLILKKATQAYQAFMVSATITPAKVIPGKSLPTNHRYLLAIPPVAYCPGIS